jgi:UDP-N-acetylmuramoylalanine-D-glutamate ligase
VPEEATYELADRPPIDPDGERPAIFERHWRRIPNPFIAVLNSEHSSTTAQLLARMWHDAGLPVAVADATTIADLADNTDPEATIIVALTDEPTGAFTPECAIALADPHDDAALLPFQNQREGQFAVLGPDTTVNPPGHARMYRVPAPDLARIGDSIALSGTADKLNAVTAAQAAMLMGVDPFSISRTLATFVV